MESHHRILLDLFKTKDLENSDRTRLELEKLTESEAANFFTDACFLSDAIPFINEKIWLQRKRDPEVEFKYKSFVLDIFARELKPLFYLRSIFADQDSLDNRMELKKALHLKNEIIRFVKTMPYDQQKVFLARSLSSMADYFRFENQMQEDTSELGIHLGFSLYQTFSSLDEVLNLNYATQVENQIKTDERIYSGSGAGVQTGYSTILMAMDFLKPLAGSRFIDLGSGYGRVGLTIGLLRPDVQFIGYEFVESRVDIAKLSVKNLGLDKHVQFMTQDLSVKNFKIPEADFYYLFDPFTDDTYSHVLAQLIEIGRQKKISIVTKGNARSWMLDVMTQENWKKPVELDNNNLCIFRS